MIPYPKLQEFVVANRLPKDVHYYRQTARNNKIDPEERHRLILDFDRVLGLCLDTVEVRARRTINDSVQALTRA